MAKKYVSLNKLSTFLDNLKTTFASLTHTHKISDITDYKIDTELSSTSNNPVANKVLDAEFEAVSQALDVFEQALDDKASSTHTHSISDVTNLQSTLDSKATQTALNSHTNNTDIHFTATERTKLSGIAAGAQVNTITGVKGNSESTYRTGNVNITKANIGLGNVDNTADANKSVKYATSAGSATSATKATQDGSGNAITSTYETKTDASAKLTEAKTYADNAAATVKNDLLNNAGAAYDTLKELGDLIDDNKDAIDALNDVAAGKANATHTHAISDVTNLQSALDGKANSSHGTHVTYSTTAPVMDGTAAVGTASTVARSDHKHPTDTSRASKTEFDNHTSDTTKHITSTERTKWNTAATNVVTAQNRADSAYSLADGKVGSLSDLGVTATATELNYVDGVTSNIQTQLDTISDELGDHTHSASDITSGTIAAARLPKATDSAAGIVSTESQSFKGEKTFTNNITTVGLRANAANTNDIGTSLAPFKNTNTKNLYIAPQSIGGSISHYGKFIAETTGTTSTKGLTKLEVGNFIEEGREGNAQGYIQIFNNDVGSVILETGHDDDRDIRVYLPENPGTLITTDDLSGYAKSSHNHSASNITSGILPIARGGTGNSNGYVQIGALSGSTVGALATAEGRNTTASGSYSHAEGNYTEATGSSSHAEGQNTTASNTAAHAEGENTTASGAYSHAEGENTIASAKHQHVQGKFNKEDSAGTYAHIVGNGTGASTSSRSNAHTLDWNGNAWYAGDIYVGGISQNDSDASKVITKADHKWNLLYDSGEISAIANSISGIDVSGYTSIQVLVRCYNDGDSVGSRNGSAIFTCENGRTYQFPVWSNMFSKSINTVFTMAQFKLVDGWLICPYASRLIGDANTFEDTEGGTAGNLSLTGSGMMKCTSPLSTLTISNLDQNVNYYFGMGSRVMVWGWNA